MGKGGRERADFVCMTVSGCIASEYLDSNIVSSRLFNEALDVRLKTGSHAAAVRRGWRGELTCAWDKRTSTVSADRSGVAGCVRGARQTAHFVQHARTHEYKTYHELVVPRVCVPLDPVARGIGVRE
jgi:hypothetical protein